MANVEDGEDSRGPVGGRWVKGHGDCGLVSVAEEEFQLETARRSGLPFHVQIEEVSRSDLSFTYIQRFNPIQNINVIESVSSELIDCKEQNHQR